MKMDTHNREILKDAAGSRSNRNSDAESRIFCCAELAGGEAAVEAGGPAPPSAALDLHRE